MIWKEVLLCVYGTLRDTLERYQVGTDTVKGELYDAGNYPAIVNVDRGEDDIEVTVHLIPETLLPYLDMYEGTPDLYQRVQVQTKHGPAFIYEFNKPTTGLKRINKWR